jgi:hypothetical protein
VAPAATKEAQPSTTGPVVITQQEKDDARLLEALATLGGSRVNDEDLLFEGRQLVIPERWTAQDALNYLRDHIEQQEEETSFARTYKYRPYDGAHALQAALRRVFGTAGLGKPIFTFFGKRPPQLVSVATGVDTTEQVPWGALEAPLFGGTIYTGVYEDPEYGPLFRITVESQRKHKAHVEGLFSAIEEELRKRSIYKGHAINGATEPEFLDLRGVTPDKVVYSEEVLTQLNANVWSLLDHTDKMRQLGMPLKRAVLLEGPYGTGKTLAAFLTAQRAVANGWTFIYCRPGKDDLEAVMGTARLYQPCVVFFEDVDTIASTVHGDDRDHVSQLLDTFDGITAKGTELMAVLTTNHKESIVKGMLRPGRLDALIHIGALDTAGIEKMVRSIIPVDTLGDIDFEQVGEAMKDYLPAFVKEAVDRTVRYALARDSDLDVLVTEDFVNAANGLREQFDLMTGAAEAKRPEPLSSALARISEKAARTAVDGAMVERHEEPFATIKLPEEELANGRVK